MAKEYNPIDKKSLIIYSVLLVIVIVVSAIVIKVPQKKSTRTIPISNLLKIPTEIGSGTTEVSGYRTRKGWQAYKGVSFDINYPIGYISKASSTNELVTFSSQDGQQKMIIYSPVAPGATPTEFIVNKNTEDVIDSASGKNPICNSLVCSREVTTIQSKDKSYIRKVLINKNNIEKTTTAFAFQYPSVVAGSDISGIFSLFQESLTKHAK